MFLQLTYLKLFFLASSCVFINSAQHDPIKENIDYTKNFSRLLRGRKPVTAHEDVVPGVRNVISAPTHIKIKIPDHPESNHLVQENPAPTVTQDTLPQSVVPHSEHNVENDPFLKELFQEFVAQYMQLSKEEPHTSVPITTTPTTLPPPPPVAFEPLPTFEKAYIPTPNFGRPSEAGTPQKSRTQTRRRKPTVVTTTIPTIEDKYVEVSSHTQAPTVSLRQKYFGVNVENEKPKVTNEFPSTRQKFLGVNNVKKQPEVAYTSVEVTNPIIQEAKMTVVHEAITPEKVTEVPVETPTTKLTPSSNLRAFFNQRFNKPRVAIQQQKPKETVKIKDEEVVTKPNIKFDEAEFRRQAESAKYEFASEIDDNINGHTHQREEVRDGLAVRGKYSFSDGYFMRTIHYEADDKGYRVVKEEVVPLEGPQYNPEGNARVSQYVAGNTHGYQITADDIKKRNQKVFFRPVSGGEEEYVDVEE